MRLVLLKPRLLAPPSDGSSQLDDITAKNAARIETAVRDALADAPLGTDDLVVLPEHWAFTDSHEAYLEQLRRFTALWGCHIVGGSQHTVVDGQPRNRGAVLAPNEEVLSIYDKLRPYSRERDFVRAGTEYGAFTLAGRRVLVLLCADFWFFDLIQRSPQAPDLICVPALSVSRKPTAVYSQSLWRHMAVARAYELVSYVAVSDWAADSELNSLPASGVAGFADPTQVEPARFFQPLQQAAEVIDVDFERLDALREDRRRQGFLWQPSE